MNIMIVIIATTDRSEHVNHIDLYMHTHTYIYIYMCIYIYIYTCRCLCTYICIYIYIYICKKERERERERETTTLSTSLPLEGSQPGGEPLSVCFEGLREKTNMHYDIVTCMNNTNTRQ